MSRMYDRLLLYGANVVPSFRGFFDRHPEYAAAIKCHCDGLIQNLRDQNPVVVVADNIAEYFFAGTDQEIWDLTEDFPSLAPPWPVAFIEFAAPSKLNSCETGVQTIDRASFGSRRAMIMQTVPVHGPTTGLVVCPTAPSDARWTQCATMLLEFAKGDISLVGFAGWNLRTDGSVIDPGVGKWKHHFFGIGPIQQVCGEEKSAEIMRALRDAYYWPTLWVAAMTYSFIHCRNTVICDHTPAPKLAKANQRRGKPPLVSFKTLEIEPVKQILNSNGRAEVNGLKKALHICRGHFKDYREHGLFGKVKGLYWWDMHIRGNIKQGVAAKEYAMPKPPGVR